MNISTSIPCYTKSVRGYSSFANTGTTKFAAPSNRRQIGCQSAGEVSTFSLCKMQVCGGMSIVHSLPLFPAASAFTGIARTRGVV